MSNFINIFLQGYPPVLSLLIVKLKDIFESNKSLIQKVESSYIYIYIYIYAFFVNNADGNLDAVACGTKNT